MVAPGKRVLPTDPEEFKNVTASYRRMARPILLCMSKLCEAAGVSPLDREEIDQGADAVAAVMYEENALFSGRGMLAMWAAGVVVPRGIEFAEKRRAKAPKERMGGVGVAQLAPVSQSAPLAVPFNVAASLETK